METENVFDRIAPNWYGLRHHTIFRAELEGLAKKWRSGKVVNIGCGHGADFLPFKDGFELHGLDSSAGILEYALKYAKKYDFEVNLVQADACHLPYNDNSFDWAIAVATYHHLKTSGERMAAFRELHRVLKPGGEAFITVWNRRQARFRFFRKEVMVPFRAGKETVYRYYHLFTYGGLERLARGAGFTIIKSFPESRYKLPVKWFSRNVCLWVRKD